MNKLTYTGGNVELRQIIYTVIHSISTLKSYPTETSIFLSKTKVVALAVALQRTVVFKEYQCTQPLKPYFAVDMYASSRPSWNISMNNYLLLWSTSYDVVHDVHCTRGTQEFRATIYHQTGSHNFLILQIKRPKSRPYTFQRELGLREIKFQSVFFLQSHYVVFPKSLCEIP